MTETRFASIRAESVVVVLLVAYGLAARLFVAWALPPWQGPDEPRHFEFSRLLLDKRAELWAERRPLRQFGDRSEALQAAIIQSLLRNGYWPPGQPARIPTKFEDIWGLSSNELGRTFSPYPYLGAIALLPFEGSDVDHQLRVVRTLSALLSTGAVVVTYLATRELSPCDAFLRLVPTGFVATLPMNVYMGGVVNPDAFATLVGSLVFWGLLRGLRRGFGWRGWGMVGVGVLVAIVGKRTGFALVPPALVAAAAVVRPSRRHGLVVAAASIVGLALVAAVALRLPPFGGLSAALGRYFLNEPDQISRLFDGRLLDPRALALTSLYLSALHASFWGIFGWFSVRLPQSDYSLLAGAVGVGMLGVLVAGAHRLIRAWRGGPPLCRRELALALLGPVLAVTLVVLAIFERLAYFTPGGVPQGRYLLIGVAAIATTLALGHRTFLSHGSLGTRGPTAVYLAALLLLDVAALVRAFGPAYFGWPWPNA